MTNKTQNNNLSKTQNNVQNNAQNENSSVSKPIVNDNASSLPVKSGKEKVTKDTNLGELVRMSPVAAEVLLDFGLHCVGCFANAFDTIEMGAKIHGMSDEEIEEMVLRVNEAIEFEE